MLLQTSPAQAEDAGYQTASSAHPGVDMAKDPRSTRQHQRDRAAAIATNDHCCICGQPIDKTLPGTHPLGPSLEHITELAAGGAPHDPANHGLAHLKCNTSAGARFGNSHRHRPHSRRL